MMMKKIGALALVVGALGLGACGGGDTAKGQALRDKMCACKDQKCMDDVEKEADEFKKELRGKYSKDDKPPQGLQDAYEGYRKCRRELRDKLEGAGSGSATP